MLAYLLPKPKSMRNQNFGLLMFPQKSKEERKKNQPRLITRILSKRRPTCAHHKNSMQVWAVRIPHHSILRTSICISSQHLYLNNYDVCYYETNKRRDIRTHTCKSQPHTRTRQDTQNQPNARTHRQNRTSILAALLYAVASSATTTNVNVEKKEEEREKIT